MPAEPILILLVVAVVANLIVMGAVLVPALLGRRGPFDLGEGPDQVPFGCGAEPAGARPEPGHALVRRRGVGAAGPDDRPGSRQPGPRSVGELEEVLAAGSTSAAFDRVVRIVAWAFILSASVIISVTGLWLANQPAIYVTLALAGLFVLVVHDVLPSAALGVARFILEGSAAIVFVTVLVILTGQAASPFFFVYPLLVGGAALVVPPAVTAILAMAAAAAYLVGVLADPSGLPPSPVTVATIGVNLTALCLLAYAGIVIARQQRWTRDLAVRLSTVDSLTGLFNRAYFFAVLEREIQRAARFRRGFCVLMMDLDGLKAINDRFGHYHGDRVLHGVATIIRAGVRGIDTAARHGGDEFVVLLPETDPSGAFVVAEKIRQGVVDLVVEAGESRIRTSLSIGVVAYPDDGLTADALMIAADEAMYGSKRLGKNRVVAFAGPSERAVESAGEPDAPRPAADEPGPPEAPEPVPSRIAGANGTPGRRRFRPVRHDEDEQLRKAMDLLLPDQPAGRRRTRSAGRTGGEAEPGSPDDSV